MRDHCYGIMKTALGMLLVGFGTGCRTGGIPYQPLFDQAGTSVKVMSWNIRNGDADAGNPGWEERKEEVCALLAVQGADILGLQEVTGVQLEDLLLSLRGYAAAGSEPMNPATGYVCPILYRRDRFELLDAGVFWLSNTPWAAGSRHWGNEAPRACGWAKLLNLQTDSSLWVYNLQLDHGSQASRLMSARLLTKEIVRQAGTDPVVVTGDFNAAPENPAMLYLGGLGSEPTPVVLADTYTAAQPDERPPGTFHEFLGRPDGAKIDYVLVRKGMTVLDAGIDTRMINDRYPSDHFPVWTVVE